MYSSSKYANPASLCMEGVAGKKVLIDARKKVANFIHAHSDEIVFTSGGTESNNIALRGVVEMAKSKGIDRPHIVISAIEHSSVIETAKVLEKMGCEITIIPVDKTGVVSVDKLKDTIKKNTVLVSIMTVNNEIGTIQPIRGIAKIIRDIKKSFGRSPVDNYPLFHTDASQAYLCEDFFVERLGVDLLTLDSGKMYGPRGVGCLYVKRGISIEPIISGGGQEEGLRSGTENIPGIMGFAKAIDLIQSEIGINSRLEFQRLNNYRAMMIAGLKKIDSRIIINGDGANFSPHILNVSIPDIDNELFVIRLDAKGIACSTKSSCLHDEDESYVLRAIGADSLTSVRFSFGRWTKQRDIFKALEVVEYILSIKGIPE